MRCLDTEMSVLYYAPSASVELSSMEVYRGEVYVSEDGQVIAYATLISA